MKLTTHRLARRRAAGLLISLVLGLLAAWLSPRFDAMERRTWDLRFVRRGVRQTTNSVAIVAVDEKTVNYAPWKDEPMALWGPHHAAVVRNLKRAGATAVGFDFVQRVSTQALAERFGMEVTFDQEFAQALYEVGNVVLVRLRQPSGWVDSVPQILYANGEENTGVANFLEGKPADADGVVRAFIPSWSGEQPIPSFAFRLVEKHLGAKAAYRQDRADIGDITIPLHRDGTMLINYVGPPYSIPSFSFCDIAEGRMPRDFDFRGKVVLIGESYAGMQDLHLTPFSRGARADRQHMPGVEAWGNAVATILDRRFLSTTPIATGRLLLIALALVTGAMFLSTSLVAGAILCAAAMLGWFLTCEGLFRAGDHLLLMFLPLCLLPINYSGITAYRFFTEEREKRQMKHMWGRYLNPAVIEYLLQHPEEQAPGGKRTQITVLFTDIRGFTTMSEKLTPTAVVKLLNEYLTAMTEVVVRHGGIVDKYVGDAIMAVWGAPTPCEDGPERAVRAALEMRDALETLNRRWEAEGRPCLAIGAGINTGEAISGNIGSPQKLDFTVIGDTVNTASRLEGLTKTAGEPIIIGQTTWEAVRQRFATRPLPPAAIRGKDEPVPIYAVDGIATPGEQAQS